MARKHKTTGLAAWIDANICPSSPLRIKISRYPPIADRLVDLVARLGCQRHAAGDRQSSGHAGQRGASSSAEEIARVASLNFSLDVKACAHWDRLLILGRSCKSKLRSWCVKGLRSQACAYFRRNCHEIPIRWLADGFAGSNPICPATQSSQTRGSAGKR